MAALEQEKTSLEGVHSRKFPIVHIHNGIAYERRKVTRENMWDLRNRALPFESQLGYNSWRIHDDVRHHIQPERGVEVVFGRTTSRHPEDIAIVTEEVREVDEKRILVIGIRVVLRGFRKGGIQTHLAQDAIIRYQPDAITGKTRKWEIPRMYEKIGLIKRFHPLEGGVTSDIVSKWLNILSPGEREDLDLASGLYSGFPAADPKEFLPPRNNTNAVRIYERMLEIGANPAQGIGFRYWAEIDKKALKEASATYNPTDTLASAGRPPRLLAAIFGLSSLFMIGHSFKK